MNQCQLLGRMTRDPELKYTPQGTAVVSFSLAVDRRFNREKAEFISKHFQKGTRIAVVGSIQTRTWEDNEGRKRKAVEVVADSVYFADAKKDAEAGSYAANAYASGDFEEVGEDEDIPF